MTFFIFMCSLACLYCIRIGKRGFRLLVEANSKSNYPCSHVNVLFYLKVNVQKHGSTVQLLTVDTGHLRLFEGKSLIFHVGEVVIRNSSKFNLEGSGRRTWPFTWWVGAVKFVGRGSRHTSPWTRRLCHAFNVHAAGHHFLLDIQIAHYLSTFRIDL